MITFREFVQAFRDLGLSHNQPVLVHASISAFGEIRGGTETVLGALMTAVNGIMTPAFTYKTMIYPETGPEDNACIYGDSQAQNSLADFFTLQMPADPTLGGFPEILRKQPGAMRSTHPILSFTGIHVEQALTMQTQDDPLAPIGELYAQHGVVLLMGVSHASNFSIHYAEQLAGRKQFMRWALTPDGIHQCPAFPGCSQGFDQSVPYLNQYTKTINLGQSFLHAVQIVPMIDVLVDLIREQPTALLCDRGDERCETIRRSILQLETSKGKDTAA